MKRKYTCEKDVTDELAELDRIEREMELYGPYDPEREEVMAWLRPPDHWPRVITAEMRMQYARDRREMALLPVDESKPYTQEEREQTARFRAGMLRDAEYWEASVAYLEQPEPAAVCAAPDVHPDPPRRLSHWEYAEPAFIDE